MKFLIYDFQNNPRTVNIGDKEIKEMEVSILSGDEVVSCNYTDGTTQIFDSSLSRLRNFNDGSYIVGKEDFDKWNNFISDVGVKSYKRRDMMLGLKK